MAEPRLLITDECRRLARWIRLMGYDAALVPATPLSALYRRAYQEQRVVVTRNHRVRAGCLFRVVQLRSQQVETQLAQLMRELGLSVSSRRAFSRCDRCNQPLETVEKATVHDAVPPYVFKTQERFRRCPSCRRVYWAATHHQRICAVLKQIQP